MRLFLQTSWTLSHPLCNTCEWLWSVHPLIVQSLLSVLSFSMDDSFFGSLVSEMAQYLITDNITGHESRIWIVFVRTSVFVRGMENCLNGSFLRFVRHLFVLIGDFSRQLVVMSTVSYHRMACGSVHLFITYYKEKYFYRQFI